MFVWMIKLFEAAFTIEAISLLPVVATSWVLSLCLYSVRYYVPNYVQVAAHHAVIQFGVSAVISAAILWVLWCHIDNLYTFVNVVM